MNADVKTEVNAARRIGFVRSDHRIAHRAVRYLADQRLGRGKRYRLPSNFRVLVANLEQCRLEAAALEDTDRFAGEVLPGGRPEAVDVIDQHRLDGVIGRRVNDRFLRRVARTLGQAIDPARADARNARVLQQSLHRVARGDYLELEAVLLREHAREIVVEARALIVGAAVAGDRTLSQEHDQLVAGRRRGRRRRAARGQR